MGSSAGRGQQLRGEETKDRLLRAGRQYLEEKPASSVMDHVRSVNVTRRAHMSPGSLYYHWDNQEKYTDALIGYVLDGLESHHCTQLEDHQKWLMRVLVEENIGFDEAVRVICDNLFTMLTRDPSFSVQIGLWASQSGDSGDAAVSDGIKGIYRAVEEQWIPGMQEMLERQSRVMREPFDLRMFATIMISMAEGLLLREKVDAEALTPVRRRDSPPWSMFSTAVLALYMAVTVPADDPNEDIRDTARGLLVDRGLEIDS